jgi:hypothetical protein
MKPLSAMAGGELLWRLVPPGRSLYELRADDERVATLRVRRGARAEAEARDGRWIFERTGFWRPRLLVRAAESGTQIGCFTARWTGSGSLAMAGEVRYHWGAANAGHSQWTWHDADGAAIVRLAYGRAPGSGAAGRITIEPQAPVLSHLALLATLGCYLALLQRQDAEDSTVAVI